MYENSLVIDADSHWTEPHDLFTKRAPAHLRDRVPRVEEIDGMPHWVFDGHPMGMATGAAVVGRDGQKVSAQLGLYEWGIEDIHVGAYDPKVRLEVMDESGIDAQVIFPSTLSLGGQDLASVGDPALSLTVIQMYNDIMAEIQAESNNRLLPMPLLPAWDVKLSAAEARRVADLGMRGVNMTSDPDDVGGPDLADPAWDELWEVCTGLELPVHFHIGASVTASRGPRSTRGLPTPTTSSWPSPARCSSWATPAWWPTGSFRGSSIATRTSSGSPSRAPAGGSPSSSRRSTTKCSRTLPKRCGR